MNLAQARAAAVHAIVDEAVASAGQQQTVQAVQAKVTAVDSNGRATVTWAGATFATRRVASYTASVNDQVLVLIAAASPVILGKIV